MKYNNHYDWLDANLMTFFDNVGVKGENNGIISAHGDKAYSYRTLWEKAGIPFYHGVAIYLLTYCYPFSKEVRTTDTGFVPPDTWVRDNYARFKKCLPPVES